MTPRPRKTAEDFCKPSTAVAGAMQVHAYAGSIERNQIPTMLIKNTILGCPISIFFIDSDGQHQCKAWCRVCKGQDRRTLSRRY